jgi:hypothetical protein
MAARVLVRFEPRKTRLQSGSAVAVEAISEATIQLLLGHGGDDETDRRARRLFR